MTSGRAVGEAFEFLRELGYVCVGADPTEVRFSSATTGIGVMFDERERSVLTVVDRVLEPPFEARANLACLFVAAGLGRSSASGSRRERAA